MKHPVPYGTMLRAARLRFVYVKRWNAFMRTSDLGVNFFLVELRPNDPKLLNGNTTTKYRIVDDPDALIKASPALSAIKSVTKPLDLILDEHGNKLSKTTT